MRSMIGSEVRLVTCEHLFGPSYTLSPRDLAALPGAVRQCQAEGQSVVAYFRSCTRAAMKVEPEDLMAIEAACPDVPFVVLATPSLNGSARIRIFKRDSGDAWEGEEDINVRLSPQAAAQQAAAQQAATEHRVDLFERNEFERHAPVALRPENHPGPPIRDWSGRSPAPRQISRRIVYLAAAVVALFGVTALWSRRQTLVSVAASSSGAIAGKAAVQTTNSPPLGLTVRQEAGMLRVMWNGDSAIAKAAVSGVLEIADANDSRTIPLVAADISRGSVGYIPRSSDVTLRLQIRSSGERAFEEVLRVLGNSVFEHDVLPVRDKPALEASLVPRRNPPPPTQPIISHPPAPKPALVAMSVQPELPRPAPTQKVTPATERANVVPPPVPTRQNAEPATPVRTERVPPSQAAEPANVPKESAPKLVASAAPSAQPLPQTPLSQPRPPVSSAAPVQVRQEAPSSPLRPPGSGVRSPVAIPAGVPVVSTPPLPLRRSVPVNRGPGSRAIFAPVTVGVVVVVDSKGRVTEARADGGSRGVPVFLLGLSLNAAREWTFTPATLGGKPVTAEHRIEFVFRPDSGQ